MEPSNADIIHEFKEHEKMDLKFQSDTKKVHEKMYERMDTLATKDDILGLKEDLKGYLIGGNVMKFTFENGGKITGVLGLIVIIFLLFKYGFLGLVAFFYHSLTTKT